MTPKQLNQLVNSLTQQGYSPRYIQRLVEEIEDHRRCIQQEAASRITGDENDTDISRMGTTNELIAAIKERHELRLFSNRYPLLTFAAAPSILLLSAMAFLIWISNWLTDSLSPGSELVNPVLGTMASVQYLFPALIAGTAGFVATRARVSIFFPIVTTLVIGGTAVFQVDMGYCGVSNSIVCYQRWEVDVLKLISIWGALFVGIVASGWLTRKNNQRWDLAN